MLIRTAVAAALVACSSADLPPDAARLMDPPPPLASTSQSLSHCDVRRFPCDPVNSASRWICESACGTAAYCRDYTIIETAYCQTHRDHVFSFRPLMWCSPSGDPQWPTNCVEELGIP